MVLFQLGAQDFINGNMTDAIQNFNNSIGIGNINPQARNNSLYWREKLTTEWVTTNATTDFRQFTQMQLPQMRTGRWVGITSDTLFSNSNNTIRHWRISKVYIYRNRSQKLNMPTH